MSSPPIAEHARHYRYYDLLLGGFVAVLLCSNLIGPAKSCTVFGITFGAGNIFFPISYIFGDVLAEVYGYARARKVIWAGFFSLIFASIMAQVVIWLPPNPSEPLNVVYQPAIQLLFGNTWRVVAGSMVAFWVGDFANSLVLTKMKIMTEGRHLWTRTIGSTIVGQALDSLIFYPIAFFGIWKTSELLKVLAINWLFKILVEVFLTPLTYAVVKFLKQAEQEDFYDRNTDFSPFSLRD